MGTKILKISDDFWNIRGSFKIAGIIDIGTQASLVRLAGGKFVFLDSYTLGGSVLEEVDQLTRNGEDVAAILNLHPFHTVHVAWMHEHYPKARHYGTARHTSRFPDLKWQADLIEDPATQLMFEDDFEFSVPRGVDFISADENLHFSSVLALHRASQTIHVDDTFMYIQLPVVMHFFGLTDSFSFHLTLAKVLEKRAGAAQDFRRWASELADNWRDAKNLCAAHTTTLLDGDNETSIHDRIINALAKVESTLKRHERKFG